MFIPLPFLCQLIEIQHAKVDTSWLLISFLLRENFELAQPKAKKNHMQIRFAPLI